MNEPDIWIDLYKQTNPNGLSPAEFLKIEKEIRNTMSSGTISDEYLDFLLWLHGIPSRQELFAEFLLKKLPQNHDVKILEVGGGRTHRLSRILSQAGYQLTCIDPQLDLTICDRVDLIKDKFDYTTFDLSPYDYVVAQEPCDATEHIVRACTSQKVPFMMSLCGVPHRLLNGKMPKTSDEWYEYLVGIASSEVKLRNLKLCPLTLTPILKSNQF